jgi:hypothetical protein
MTDNRLDVTDVEEHEDGSATLSFVMDSETSEIVSSLGLQFLLYCGAYGLTTEEALRIIQENGNSEGWGDTQDE